MGITFGDHLIDSGYYDITPEQEREREEQQLAQTREDWARQECKRRGIDPNEVVSDGGVEAWMVLVQGIMPVCPHDCYRPGDCDGSCTHPEPKETCGHPDIKDLIEQLIDGCRQCGESDDGSVELFDIEGANDLMADAAETIERMMGELRRVTDHLEEWARYHSDERTAEIDAAIFCARQVLTRADDKPTNADSDDAGCVRDF